MPRVLNDPEYQNWNVAVPSQNTIGSPVANTTNVPVQPSADVMGQPQGQPVEQGPNFWQGLGKIGGGIVESVKKIGGQVGTVANPYNFLSSSGRQRVGEAYQGLAKEATQMVSTPVKFGIRTGISLGLNNGNSEWTPTNPILKYALGEEPIAGFGEYNKQFEQTYGKSKALKVIEGLNLGLEALGPAAFVKGGGPFEMIDKYALKPVLRNTVGRLMAEDASAVSKLIEPKELKTVVNMGKDVPNGVPFSEQADVSELYRRQRIVEEQTQHQATPQTDPQYWDRVKNVSPEEVQASYRKVGTPITEQVFGDYQAALKDQAVEKLSTVDIYQATKEAATQTVNAVDDDARAMAKKFIAAQKFSKGMDTSVMEQRAFEAAKKQIQAKFQQTGTSSLDVNGSKVQSPVVTDAVSGPPPWSLNELVSINPIDGVQKLRAAEVIDNLVKDSGTVSHTIINRFIDAVPEFKNFAPYLHDLVTQKLDTSKIIQAIKDAPDTQIVKFQPGSASEKIYKEQIQSKGSEVMWANKSPELGSYKLTKEYLQKYPQGKQIARAGNPTVLREQGIQLKPIRIETPSATLTGPTELSPATITPVSTMESIRRGARDLIKKSGLSPIGNPDVVIRSEVRGNFKRLMGKQGADTVLINPDGLGKVAATSDEVYSRLWDVAMQKQQGWKNLSSGVYGLTKDDIIHGLGVDAVDAASIKAALVKSRNTSLETAGLGPKIFNSIRYSNTGLGNLYNRFVDLTVAAHFKFNPFFGIRWAVKQNILAKMEGAPLYLGNRWATQAVAGAVNSFAEKLGIPGMRIGIEPSMETRALWDQAFNRGRVDVIDQSNAADIAGNEFFKQPETKIPEGPTPTKPYFKPNIDNPTLKALNFYAGDMEINLISAIGKKRGFTSLSKDPQIAQREIIEQVIAKPEVYNDIQQVVGRTMHYGDGYLNSPLAKTLNVMFYPSRFSTKVLQLTSDFLVKQPALVQATVMHGLLNGVLWLQSPEGKQWTKENQAAVNLINNIIPYTKIAESFAALTDGRLPDIGLIGGLPAGFIQTILQEEGVIKSDYQNPKTGLPYITSMPRGVNHDAAVLAAVGMLRSIFPVPVSTFTLGKVSSPYNALKSYYLTRPGGGETKTRNAEMTPRPDNLIPDSYPEPLRSILREMLNENGSGSGSGEAGGNATE